MLEAFVSRFARISRRSLLQQMTVGAGAAALAPLFPAQTKTTDPLVQRIQADLEKHAGFGIKRSATPGDLQTADWIAQRLRSFGYKVASHEFAAPFFEERAVKLSTEGLSLK